MLRLDRYAFEETLLPALATLAIATFLLFTTQILRVGEATFGRGLTASDFALVLLLLLPRLGLFTVPIALLVGVVTGLGRMSDDGEVLALESAGLRPTGLWRGPMLLSLACALLMGFLSLFGEPWALATLSGRLASVVQRNLILGLTPGEIHEEVPGTALYAARRASDGTLEQVLLRMERGDRVGTVLARRARLVPGAGSALTLEVEAGEMAIETELEGETPSLTRARFDHGRITLDISRTIARRVRFIGALDVLDQPALAARLARLEGPAARKAAALYYRRVALPFGALALGLVGIALGLRPPRRRGEGRGASVLLGVGALAFYFVGGRITEAMALSGVLPVALAPFLPLLVLAAAGLLGLWHRQSRT